MPEAEKAVNAARASLAGTDHRLGAANAIPVHAGDIRSRFPSGAAMVLEGGFRQGPAGRGRSSHISNIRRRRRANSRACISTQSMAQCTGVSRTQPPGITATSPGPWGSSPLTRPRQDADPEEMGAGLSEGGHPFNLDAGYANFMMDDEGEARVKAAYGQNYERLAMVKRKYDPANLFRVNQNIPPAS